MFFSSSFPFPSQREIFSKMSTYWKIFSLLSVTHLCLVYKGVILIIFFSYSLLKYLFVCSVSFPLQQQWLKSLCTKSFCIAVDDMVLGSTRCGKSANHWTETVKFSASKEVWGNSNHKRCSLMGTFSHFPDSLSPLTAQLCAPGFYFWSTLHPFFKCRWSMGWWPAHREAQ